MEHDHRGGIGKEQAPVCQSSATSALRCALAGFAITPLTFSMAFFDILNYHASNNYTFTKCTYPGALLLTNITGGSITMVSIVAALVQFPFYGFVIGISKKNFFVISLVLFYHLLLVMFAFMHSC